MRRTLVAIVGCWIVIASPLWAADPDAKPLVVYRNGAWWPVLEVAEAASRGGLAPVQSAYEKYVGRPRPLTATPAQSTAGQAKHRSERSIAEEILTAQPSTRRSFRLGDYTVSYPQPTAAGQPAQVSDDAEEEPPYDPSLPLGRLAIPPQHPAPFGPGYGYGPGVAPGFAPGYGPGFGQGAPFGSSPGQDYIAVREYEIDVAQRFFNVNEMELRRERLLSANEKAQRSGLEQFRRGDYAASVVAFTLASELNHGDPASRVHLAQARLALGHYDAAARAIRRALELQPKLIFVPLRLERHYANSRDFTRHVQALEEYVGAKPSGDLQFLLGFFQFQRGEFDDAHKAFRAALRYDPSDEHCKQFLDITMPASGGK